MEAAEEELHDMILYIDPKLSYIIKISHKFPEVEGWRTT